MNPFDLTKTIIDKKFYLEDLFEYNPHIINKILAQYPDTVLYANEMNMNYSIPVRWQYDYYFYAIRAKKRYSKWFKHETDETIKAIMNYFNMNERKAKEALSVLSQDQILIIKKKCTEVGLKPCYHY